MKVKLALVVFALALLSGCGGYDEAVCFQSAIDHMEHKGGEAHLIPGERWTYLGTTEDSVFYMEAMALSHCDLTTVYQINR